MAIYRARHLYFIINRGPIVKFNEFVGVEIGLMLQQRRQQMNCFAHDAIRVVIWPGKVRWITFARLHSITVGLHVFFRLDYANLSQQIYYYSVAVLVHSCACNAYLQILIFLAVARMCRNVSNRHGSVTCTLCRLRQL
jgi:hypothetical protein